MIPCEKCILLATCKSTMCNTKSPVGARFKVMNKCSLLKDYIDAGDLGEITISGVTHMSTKKGGFIIVSNPHVEEFYKFMDILLTEKDIMEV